MNRNKILHIFAFCCILIIASCQNDFSELEQNSDEIISLKMESTSDIHPTAATILSMHHDSGARRSRGESAIDCITDALSDTLLYVYNKPEGGWIIYSSDARVPAVVAESEHGSFAELMKNDNARIWIETVSEDMKAIRGLPDQALNFSKDEIECHKDFWRAVSNPDKFVNEKGLSRKPDLPIDPLLPTGHYEYLGSTSYTQIFDSIPRLTKTNWHQDSPHNAFCPNRKEPTPYEKKAKAGCVAIAGAQILYYLHNKYGYPQTAPSKAYCYGTVGDQDYHWNQYDFSTTIWDEMSRSSVKSAPMIAHIGNLVGMEYGDNGSASHIKQLAYKAFPQYGVESKFMDYDPEEVKASLLKNHPVIIGAGANHPKIDKTVGHAFIIDRYKRIRKTIITTYRWVYDYLPNDQLVPNVKDSVIYSIQTPEINMIGMNWGEGLYYNNESEWYALTGDWIKTFDVALNWNILREMVVITGVKFE